MSWNLSKKNSQALVCEAEFIPGMNQAASLINMACWGGLY
jgi:hypothetical protein